MQKIRNRSNFFQKIFLHKVYCQKFWKQYRFFEKICHIGYISKIFENVHAFQNFFQKIFLWHPPADRTSSFLQYPMRQFAKFAKTPLYRGYFQNHHQLCPSFLTFFQKSLPLHRWLSEKVSKSVTPLPHFFQKKFVSPLLTIAKTPKKGHTLSELFFKKLSSSTEVRSQMLPPCVAAFRKKSEKHHLYPVVYHLFTPILLLCFSTFLKKKHSSSIGVISKTDPCCVATFEKKSKNLLHTTDYQDYPPVL